MSPQWSSAQGPSKSIWQVSHLTSLQNQLIIIFTIVLTLSLIFTGFRIWSRRIKCLQLLLNDYLALAACFFNLIYFIVLLLNIFLGAGRAFTSLQNPMAQIKKTLQVNVAVAILWSLVNTLVKLSMASLYTHLFPSRTMRHITLTFSLATLTNFLFAIVVAALACQVGESASKQQTSRNCYIALGSINLLLDICVIAIPIPSLLTLKLRVAKKASLIGIFMLGFIITAISAVRVLAFSRALKGGREAFTPENTFQMPLWSFLETSLSVVNACAPVVVPAVGVIGRGVGKGVSYLSGSMGKRGGSTAASESAGSQGAGGKVRGGVPDGEGARGQGRSLRTPESETRESEGEREEEERWKEAFYVEETQVGDEESLVEEGSLRGKRERN